MPADVKERAEKELKRLSQLSPHNPEGGYIRNYLDWLVEMPWSKATPNNVSVTKAAKVLEDDHYGLKKAKERIIEYLAVMKVKKDAEKKVSDAVKLVSKHLGNTTSVCRTYYIHPAVIAAYQKQELIPYFQSYHRDYTGGIPLSRTEYSVHRLLKHYSR